MGPVLVLTMNRPERHHALNAELSKSLAAAITRAEADADVRAVIVTGSGSEAFCAGQDMLEVGSSDTIASYTRPSTYIAVEKFSTTLLPIIAAINGYCFGGGAVLAITCDIRLAAQSATFRLPGAEYGLVVGAATLPRLVGASKAKELILTARKFDAAEAWLWPGERRASGRRVDAGRHGLGRGDRRELGGRRAGIEARYRRRHLIRARDWIRKRRERTAARQS